MFKVFCKLFEEQKQIKHSPKGANVARIIQFAPYISRMKIGFSKYK
jgi:hypothetical protein